MIRTFAHARARRRPHAHALAVATGVLAGVCGQVFADDPITLVWSAVAGGGGSMSADGFELSATVGQSQVSAILTDGTFTLYNGYWVPGHSHIHSRCVGDFNRDGSIDFFDYDAFVEAFEAGLPSADVNWDSTVDFFDYDAFVEFFESGC